MSIAFILGAPVNRAVSIAFNRGAPVNQSVSIVFSLGAPVNRAVSIAFNLGAPENRAAPAASIGGSGRPPIGTGPSVDGRVPLAGLAACETRRSRL